MPNPNYKSGRHLEYRVRDEVAARGATLVVRAAGSKGSVDLVVFWPQDPSVLHHYKGRDHWEPRPHWLVQVKRDGYMRPAERKALRLLAGSTGGQAIMACSGPKGRGIEFKEVEL